MDGLSSVLTWMTGSDAGAFVIVAWFLSWLLEGWGKWEGLSSRVKSLVVLGIALLLGLGSVWLKQNPALVAQIDPYFRAGMYAILAWLGTQVAHRANSLRKEKAFLPEARDVEDAPPPDTDYPEKS